LGTQENPIVWGSVPSGDTQTALKAFLELTDLLADETDRYFEIFVADEYTDIVEYMCATPIEVHMGSLNTFSYLLANDRCDVEAELVAVRYGSSTYNGQIIANVNSGIQSLGDLDGVTFCRPDPLSTSGWVIPMLTIRANGINPYEDLEIVDAGSHDAVVTAVYNGECDAGATYVDARGAVEGNTPDVMDRVPVIATTVDVPNDGVQFASSIDDDLKDEIVAGLLAISDTEEGQEALNTVFYWTGLEKRGDGFYDSFRQVLQRSGMTIENLVY
jgi:phosphonate transport system substrate-binding protein